MSTKKSKKPVQRIESLKAVRPSGKYDLNFFQQVHEVARQIPYGRVTSYGAIAACLGAKSSSRMVGWAMNNAHTATPPVPAHRVVNRNGLLTGKHHFPSETAMEELLAKEGIRVVNDKVVEWKQLFWEPGGEEKGQRSKGP
jgi:methylated-DNA-protein-cysteine methyltransferase related protein